MSLVSLLIHSAVGPSGHGSDIVTATLFEAFSVGYAFSISSKKRPQHLQQMPYRVAAVFS